MDTIDEPRRCSAGSGEGRPRFGRWCHRHAGREGDPPPSQQAAVPPESVPSESVLARTATIDAHPIALWRSRSQL
jgi:hypothetical protein